MPGGAEGSYCSANEPASISGHGSASQQSDSVVNALKVTLLRYSPCKTSCLLLNTCRIVLATFLWTPLGCYCHERDCFSVCHSLHLWTVCSSALTMGMMQAVLLSKLLRLAVFLWSWKWCFSEWGSLSTSSRMHIYSPVKYKGFL